MASFQNGFAQASCEKAVRGPKTVLIVDDDPGFRYLCSNLLSRSRVADYVTLEAADGQRALSLLSTSAIDCAVIDYNLPDMTGAHLMDSIRYATDWHGAMVLVTAVGSEDVAAEALRAGAVDYISKSVPPRELDRALGRALDKANLHNAIRRQTSDLASANQDLLKKNNEIARFYHRISHEVKTPLTAARMFMSILAEEVVGSLSGEQKEIVELAIDSCDQLTMQFNDLIECTRLETGKLNLRMAEESLDRVLRLSIIALRAAMEAKSITLSESICPEVPQFQMDGGRITQVVANILGNAVKFTEPGGAIHIESRLSDESEDRAEILITDNGCGISPDCLPNVFDRLYQVGEGGDNLQGAGLGLGLTIAKEIVELHGGRILAESTPGKGSTFCVQLPINRSESLC